MGAKKKEKEEKDRNKVYDYGLSSRIKKIFIELHSYSFFHGPSEIQKIDRRFIGREAIINKLKSILTNNDTRSGAYLVTGYRGMGKSSFVSKVINETDRSSRRSVFWLKMIRVFLFLILFSFFNWDFGNGTNWLVFAVSFSLAVLLLVILVLGDKDKNHLKIDADAYPDIRRFSRLHWRLFKAIAFSSSTESEKRYIVLIQTLCLAFLIYSLTTLFIKIWPFSTGSFAYQLMCYAGLSVFLWIFRIWYFKQYQNKKQFSSGEGEVRHWSRVKRLVGRGVEKIKAWLKSSINYSKRIYIKINLGYDDLKDIDILRLISRNIEKEYRDFGRFPRKTVVFNAFKIFFTFILVAIIYYYGPVYKLNQSFKEKMGISKYFPSQVEDDQEIKKFKDEPGKKMEQNNTFKNFCILVDHFALTIYDRVVNAIKSDGKSSSGTPFVRIYNSWVHGDEKNKKEKGKGVDILEELTKLDYFLWI